MDTLTVLRKARAILEDEARLTNDAWICDDGRCCLAGACGLAAGLSDNFSFDNNYQRIPSLFAAMEALADAGREERLHPLRPHVELTGINREIAVSPSAALELFDRAIAAEEAKLAPAPATILNRPARRRESNCDRGLVPA